MPSLEENIDRVATYYAALAPEFDRTTEIGSESQERLHAPLKARYREAFRGLKVLELACGTGYWTEMLASTAEFVLATDVNHEMIDIAQRRLQAASNVRFQVASAYSLTGVPEDFSGAFSHFWWSHVPKKKLADFLDTLHSKLQPGALVLFADALEYSSSSIRQRVDEHGDIYEERLIPDGRRFETIKNFPSKAEFHQLLDPIADDVQYGESGPFWIVSYRVRHK